MKIQYKNKVAIDLDPLVPEVNKVTDGNMNEIKTVVNANADTLDNVEETVTDFISGADTRLGNVETAMTNLEDEMDSFEETINGDISDLEGDISNIQDTTYTKTEVNDLLDNKANVSSLNDEISNRENADTNLQNQIDAISASSDVVDIVGTYQDLQNYDTSKLRDNDIIKVLDDSTHNNATSYFRWKKTSSQWQYIGSEGPYYTKSETDTLLNGKVNVVAGKGLSQNDFTNALKTKLDGIQAGAQVNTITGVKGNSESSYRTGNVNITKGNIGLGNVDNTSDLNKPISTATQNALNEKVNISSISTSLSGSSTNEQVAGAKAVYDYVGSVVGNINSVLDSINGEVI